MSKGPSNTGPFAKFPHLSAPLKAAAVATPTHSKPAKYKRVFVKQEAAPRASVPKVEIKAETKGTRPKPATVKKEIVQKTFKAKVKKERE